MKATQMEKEPGCQDDSDPASLPVDEAQRRILETIQPLQTREKVALRQALNRVLADSVRSRIDVPAAVNSAMDGYAIHGSDIPGDGTRELKVIGTVFAGKPLDVTVPTGACARIMTGAILPAGTDTVVIQERVSRNGDMVCIDNGARQGDNVRQAGEDIAAGEVVLQQGHRLTPADLGLLASLGIGEAAVTRNIRIAFFSTGDELRSIGEPLDPGCVYDSNRYTLYGMLTRVGVEIVDMGVIPDVREEIQQAFLRAADCADVVITSGGVSVGEADFVRETLRVVGNVEFWKVAMKPGRPLAFGKVDDAYFFGLPGNPVSVMVTFYQFVLPALRRLAGETGEQDLRLKASAVNKLKKRPGRVEFQRGILEFDDSAGLTVRRTGAQGSGILSSMSQANCFIILPMDSTGAEPGELVEVQPFFGLV